VHESASIISEPSLGALGNVSSERNADFQDTQRGEYPQREVMEAKTKSTPTVARAV